MTHTDALARTAHALGDPTRARILLELRQAPAYPSDLAERLAVSRQVISNQLACLRGCGLVTTRPQGRRTEYRLADPRLAHALGDLLDLTLVVDPACCGPDCTCAAGPAPSGTVPSGTAA
nr:metalloregulator ArsR/SmtB family transcription factor [Isoptericola chiayiensis]